MTVEAKLSIMIQIAEGLSHAHKHGILHRDLGPAKIHLAFDGKAKIRDFAIASVLMRHLPHPWIRFGAPIYLSPEQIQQKSCDQRSDIFSLGTIFYEFLTYHHPFYDRDSNKTLDNIIQDMPVPTFDLFPDEPPGIWPILKTCLERDPNDRYQSIDEVFDACRSLLKDLGEDSRLMLSELFAALTPLRRATTSPNASAESIKLLQSIEQLLRGEKEIDYISLDRLMNSLIEQYPVVRTESDSLPTLDSANPGNPPLEMNILSLDDSGLATSGRQAGAQDLSPSVPGPGIETACENTKHIQAAYATEPPVKPEEGDTPKELLMPEPAAHDSEINQDAVAVTDPPESLQSGVTTHYRRMRRPSYRATVVLLSLLLIASAAYIAWRTELPSSLTNILKARLSSSGVVAGALGNMQSGEASNKPSSTIAEADTIPKDNTQALSVAQESRKAGKVEIIPDGTNQPPKGHIARISGLINSGKLQPAKAELDRLQQTNNEKAMAVWKQREDEWSRRIGAFLTRGQYDEANNAINLWLSDNVGSEAALVARDKIVEIQRNLNIYASSMAENRYQEALGAITAAERLNPADANFAELRKQIETKRAAAKSSLSVYRLGAKAALFLDGQQIGNEGELENESLPIGAHTIAIESGGNPALSKRLVFAEDQRVTLIYDLARQQLRTMVDTDRELIAQRKTMEEVRYFDVEHEHGAFRGICRGLLMIDYLDVAFRPSAGLHGFRIPFKLMKLNVKGRSADLIYISDNRSFQSFKLRDEQAAEKLKRSWDELKAMIR
jgi:serine/threonine protein kinase/tetratricopeptide (TPR) repeat protein